jgi:hypothetical protein
MTPTQRTLKLLRDNGYTAGIVERYISYGKFGNRVDLFGIIDIIAIKPDWILGVQSCGMTFSNHKKKITEQNKEQTLEWLSSGGRLILVGWRKLKIKRGGRAFKYMPRICSFQKLGDEIITNESETFDAV